MQAVYLVRSALPHLNASHGNIVAISSGSGTTAVIILARGFYTPKCIIIIIFF